MEYAGQRTAPFHITKDAYANTWQDSLDNHLADARYLARNGSQSKIELIVFEQRRKHICYVAGRCHTIPRRFRRQIIVIACNRLG